MPKSKVEMARKVLNRAGLGTIGKRVVLVPNLLVGEGRRVCRGEAGRGRGEAGREPGRVRGARRYSGKG